MIYLDNNATTQVLPEVAAAMLPYLTECYGNASSPHAAFTGADRPRGDAADAMATLLNAEETECFTFTSGATEANNWIIRAAASGPKRRVVISAIEHASIHEPVRALEEAGHEVVRVPVSRTGVVRLDELEAALNSETDLVSILAANNETGAIQPIAEAGRIIRTLAPQAIFHTDATQAVGKLRIDLQTDWETVDMMSFSAHKFHGPKAIGGLYRRPGTYLRPLMLGGGQENGLRAGTINTHGLAGLAAAAKSAAEGNLLEIERLRDRFERGLRRAIPSVVIHAEGAARLPNTSFFSIPGIRSEDAAFALAEAGVLVGTGSACSSGAIEPSRTLLAMGVPFELADAALRVSLSRMTTHEEVETALDRLNVLASRCCDPAQTLQV